MHRVLSEFSQLRDPHYSTRIIRPSRTRSIRWYDAK